MNTQEAVNFAIESIRIAKQSMIEQGISDPQFVWAVCRRFSAVLNLDIDTVIQILEIV